MSDFKVLVDVLSSIAALVAIATVLFAWARDRRKPIEVSRMIISPKSNRMRAFVELKNVKVHPVSVTYFSCYSKCTYEVKREFGGRPKMYPAFDVADRMFSQTETIEILELGQFVGEFYFDSTSCAEDGIVFLIHTSHGNFSVKPKSISMFSEQISVIPKGSVVSKTGEIQARAEVLKGYGRFLWENVRRKL